MGTSMSRAGRPAFYSIPDVACLLCVPPDRIHRAIRVGALRVVRRRNGLMVSAHELHRLLSGGEQP